MCCWRLDACNFGFACNASAFRLQQQSKEVATTSAEEVRTRNPLMALSSDAVKTECAVEMGLLNKSKAVIKVEKEVCGLLNLLKKT